MDRIPEGILPRVLAECVQLGAILIHVPAVVLAAHTRTARLHRILELRKS